jgi:hypothetical protein
MYESGAEGRPKSPCNSELSGEFGSRMSGETSYAYVGVRRGGEEEVEEVRDRRGASSVMRLAALISVVGVVVAAAAFLALARLMKPFTQPWNHATCIGKAKLKRKAGAIFPFTAFLPLAPGIAKAKRDPK